MALQYHHGSGVAYTEVSSLVSHSLATQVRVRQKGDVDAMQWQLLLVLAMALVMLIGMLESVELDNH